MAGTSAPARRPIPAETELIRGRGPEFYIALGAALAVLFLLVFASTVTYVYDLGLFQRAVTRFFRIEPPPPAYPLSQAHYATEGAAREEQRLLDRAGGRLFEAPPESELDRPDFRASAPHAIPAQPYEISLPTAAARPGERLEALETLNRLERTGPDVPVLRRREARREPKVSLPDLGELYSSGRESGGGPGRPGASGGKMLLKPPPFPETPNWSVVDNPPAATVHRDAVENVGALSRALLDRRPPGGYPSLDRDVDASFTVYQAPGAEDCYFRLSLALRPDSAVATMAKDVLFLVDVSQSISNREIQIARTVVDSALQALHPRDRWNLAIFSQETAFFQPEFLPAPAGESRRAAATEFIRRRRGERRTNVFDATQRLLRSLPRSDRPCNVFLLSDGKATEGTGDVRRIVEDFQRIRRETFSIFTFNMGEGGDLYLLRLLAYRSRGFHLDAPDLDTAAATFSRYAQRFEQPVLSHVVLSHTSMETDDVHPQVLPNLYRGNPIVIHGRAVQGRTVTLRVAGYGQSGPREFFFRAEVPRGDARHPEVARDWAQGKAHTLMARLADDPKNDALREALIALAEKHQLAETLDMVKPQGLFSPLRKLLKR